MMPIEMTIGEKIKWECYVIYIGLIFTCHETGEFTPHEVYRVVGGLSAFYKNCEKVVHEKSL